jgi:hypothetical protein
MDHKRVYRLFELPEEQLFPCPLFQTSRRCKSWDCPSCSIWLARRMVRTPIFDLFRVFGADHHLAHVILTVPRPSLTPGEIQTSYARLLRRLRDAGLLWAAYIATWGARPTPHRHLATAGAHPVSNAALTRHAQAVGLGFTKTVSVESANAQRRVANYLPVNALEFVALFPKSKRTVKVVSPSRSRCV